MSIELIDKLKEVINQEVDLSKPIMDADNYAWDELPSCFNMGIESGRAQLARSILRSLEKLRAEALSGKTGNGPPEAIRASQELYTAWRKSNGDFFKLDRTLLPIEYGRLSDNKLLDWWLSMEMVHRNSAL